MMRKSSLGGRASLAGPLRVRTDDNVKPSSSRQSVGCGLSSGNRLSIGSRPSLGGRPSIGRAQKPVSRYSAYPTTAGQKRRHSSGIGIRGRTDVPKDPRPISDKSFQHKLIRQLLEWLTDKGYSHPISQKILVSPPSKEFFRIFEFLNGHLEPKYKIGPKPEEEIPKIFKVLGYPFSISKSSMFAIGSPHTWPYLLAALIWLVELIKMGHFMSDKAGIEAILFPHEEDDFDSSPENKLLFEYCENTYAAFLSEEDEYDAYDEELSRMLKDKYQGTGGGIDALIAENARLKQELELLEQDGDRLVGLQEQREVVRSDMTRFDQYLEEMSSYRHKLEVQQRELEEDNGGLEAEYRSVEQKNKHMQAIYETQNLTPADVERLKLNRQELQRQIDALDKEIEQDDLDNWKEEMNMAKSRERMETKSSEYNKMAHGLKLVPVSAENACGVDYELKTSYQNTMTVDFDSTIKPALMQLKKQCNVSLNEKSRQLLIQQDSLEQLSELVTEQQDAVRVMEKNLNIADEEYKTEKESFQQEVQNILEDIELKQKMWDNGRKSSQLCRQETQKEFKDAVKLAEQRKIDLLDEDQRSVEFLDTVIREVVAHKTAISERLQEVVADTRVLQQKTQEETEKIFSCH
ncbi:kinetochore protein NDC80 homolog [Haliotis rufescens]|uniref:kinetochore protein NDC80 homolog n=1 Tax=Haliotis rufescens TaxID=6454 RepID=UPI001EB04BDC|nr:kinetochore protein NDC80 homolog [Haliotis rufescens]XP_046327299.1 kinetochore protein NDC80 homolog [Haliotis rufescens]